MDTSQTITQKIELYNVKRYLQATGWVECETLLKNVLLYRRKEPTAGQEFDEILIPSSKNLAGYDLSMQDACRRLCIFNGQPISDILWNMQYPAMDKISFRLISEQVKNGSIDLAGAEQFFGGIIGAVKAALKDTQQPSVSHSRLSGREIDNLLKSSRFGQTEKGSFIVNVHIPIEEPAEQKVLPELEEHLFRNAMEHLMGSMKDICEAIDQGNVDTFAAENLKNPVISSNLLVSIRNTWLWEDADIEIRARWSPLVPTRAPEQIYLSREVFPVMDQWIEQFRPSQIEKQKQEFRGKVIELRGTEQDEAGNTFGEVLLSVMDDIGETFEAKTFLENAELYEIAIESHRRNRFVKFFGTSVHGLRKAQIQNIQDFQLDRTEAPSP